MVALQRAQQFDPTSTTGVAAVSAGVAWRTPAGIVGNTPTLWIGDALHSTDTDRGYWAKLEGHNPGGMKDRAALHMVSRARDRGELRPGGRIVESSSGTLGLGLALAGVVYGHPVTVVTDPGMEPLVVHMLRAYGAHVDMVDSPDPVGGWQQARRDRVRQLLEVDQDAWCPDQYNNLDNIDAYAGLATELLAQVGRIDVLVASVGTGGHSAGVSRVLREHFPELSVVGVDSIRSTIFGQPAGARLMRRQQHLSGQRGLFRLHGSALGRTRRGGLGMSPAGVERRHDRRLERGRGRGRGRLGRSHVSSRNAGCGGVSGRTAALLGHRLQRRVLRAARTRRRETCP
jgi:cysteine synthase